MAERAAIFGCLGPELSPDERAFFAEADPWGFILFARNIEDPGQVRRLTSGLRDAVGRDAPVLIDQEGGRVARMRGPHWREWLPALDQCEALPSRELRARAMYLRSRLIAEELGEVGIDVNCAPVLDLVTPETHEIIRNRCYGADPAEIAVIGRAVADGLLSGGVLPVMKHMPGQGRAPVDSHKGLPAVPASRGVLREQDFVPLRELADLPLGMTCHVIFEALDPERPATLSGEVIRMIRSEIGFGGLLMTDDLSMHALRGGFRERAEQALAAGCDVVLHCNGDRAEMEAVAEAAPVLAGEALERSRKALSLRVRTSPEDKATVEAEFDEILGSAAHA